MLLQSRKTWSLNRNPRLFRQLSSIHTEANVRNLYGRGDWRPGIRIEGILRYAFIGDSFMYGPGVAPNQTLPANAGRQMNEMLPAWPVEAVNLGVPGYNLWNSWLSFKHAPQVYDGIVLVLCNNDSELLGFTCQIFYSEPPQTRWESTHPFGQAVALCFDEIAAFSQERSLPVAIIFSNPYDSPGQARIGGIIGDLCAKRSLCFIDTLALYRDRNFKLDDLQVSSANRHPSAIAHEAVGRHLAMTLKRQGWFDKYDDSSIGAAPGRILAGAKAMVETDNYPPDAALNWALGALESKLRLARRMEALGAEVEFSAAADEAAEALNAASRRWHMANRARAFVLSTSTGSGISSALACGEGERLKLDELAFALGTGDWPRISAHSLDANVPEERLAAIWPSDVPDWIDDCIQQLQSFPDSLRKLRSLAAPAAAGWSPDEAIILADLRTIEELGARAQSECAALKVALLRMNDALEDVRPALSEAHFAQVSNLIDAAAKRVKGAFGFVQNWRAALERIQDQNHAAFTSVEVTMSCGPVEDNPSWMLYGVAESIVPHRLPFQNTGYFRSDGSPTLVKLYFPLFYAGRLILRQFLQGGINAPKVEAALIKVEIYNQSNRRQAIEPTSFYKDSYGRLISPLFYLV
jgi:hypothetical protein